MSKATRKLIILLPLMTTLVGVGVMMVPGAAQAMVVRRSVYVAPRPYHPVARTAAVVGTAAVTAAIVGSTVRTLPPQCSSVMMGNVVYQQCGSTYYQPQYAGSQVTYVVVNPPR